VVNEVAVWSCLLRQREPLLLGAARRFRAARIDFLADLRGPVVPRERAVPTAPRGPLVPPLAPAGPAPPCPPHRPHGRRRPEGRFPPNRAPADALATDRLRMHSWSRRTGAAAVPGKPDPGHRYVAEALAGLGPCRRESGRRTTRDQNPRLTMLPSSRCRRRYRSALDVAVGRSRLELPHLESMARAMARTWGPGQEPEQLLDMAWPCITDELRRTFGPRRITPCR
jgi:hypothetical protein